MINLVVSFVLGGLVGIIVVFRAFQVMPSLLTDYMLTGGRNTSVSSVLKGLLSKRKVVKPVEEGEVKSIVKGFGEKE